MFAVSLKVDADVAVVLGYLGVQVSINRFVLIIGLSLRLLETSLRHLCVFLETHRLERRCCGLCGFAALLAESLLLSVR